MISAFLVTFKLLMINTVITTICPARHMKPNGLYILNPLTTVAKSRTTTLAIIHMQLKNKLLVSIMTGPPFIETGSRHFINHGRPKHNNISIVLEPNALLMIIDPSSGRVNEMKQKTS